MKGRYIALAPIALLAIILLWSVFTSDQSSNFEGVDFDQIVSGSAGCGATIAALGLGVLLLAGSIAFYFLPSIVAHKRRHPQETAITVLNFLAGWTFIGWVGALVWAFVDQR